MEVMTYWVRAAFELSSMFAIGHCWHGVRRAASLAATAECVGVRGRMWRCDLCAHRVSRQV
eukprot:5113413-Prymnesium_polylepis.2